ncbi:hypothetical protein BR93DRAFT_965863 [Coniochaeta sp. PMI_546]|nr:hypothetical protein BR93DRAFT_965863 [Coniochaeta sp. PMI_546]
MADAIADSGLLGREDDMSFLEIDFDEAAGAAGSNDDSHAGIAQENEAPADDFDIQIDEFEVVENAGDYRDNGSIPSGDPTHADLSVPQGNTAESEIGYEDEEPLKAETTSQKSKAAPQEQGNDKIVGSTGNVDEIDYDDGDLEAIHEDHPATEPRPVLETLKQQEIATAPVPSQQVLDDTVEQAESAQHDMGAEDGSSDEPSEAGQGVFEKDERIFHTGGYPEDSLTGAPASEVSDVMVFYNGIKYELCASVHNDDPETYFFASNAEMDVPLSQFFGLLRDVIKDEIEPSDDLVIRVPQLKLEFGEDFSHDFLEKHTIRNILDLYRRFKYNDGQDAEHSQLVVHLVAKPNCQERFAMLSEAADAGRGWSEFFDNSDGSDSSSGHHSDEEPDGEQAESGSREDQTSFTGDDMQHEAVEIVEEAYFYDDTNDAGEHDAEHLFNDQDVEDPGHHADNIDDLNQGYELTDELVDNDEFDQVPGGVDNSMGYDHDGSTHQTYTDHDGNWPLSHADADTENMSTATGAFPGVTGEFTGGSEHESFNEEAGSALEQANTFANGNHSFPYRPPAESVPHTQHEWMKEFLERDSKDITPEMWKKFDALPHSPSNPAAGGAAGGDEDLIDYSDDEDLSSPPAATQYLRRFSPPPHFPRRHGKSILDVPSLSNRGFIKPRSDDDGHGEPDDDFVDYEEVDHQTSSVVPGENIIPSIEMDEDVFAGGESGITVPSFGWLKEAEAVSMPSASLARHTPSPMKPASGARRPVCKYRGVGKSKHPVASQQTRSSISPGQAARMMEPQTAAQSAFASSSNHSPLAHSTFALELSSNFSQSIGANLLDSQDHLESTIQSDDGADVETTHASLAQNDFEDDDGDDDDDDDNFAPNDNSIDMEGLTAYDEAANNEPLAAELDTRATDSRDTSATSTVNGDEITYEDENLALANTENGTHEAGDDTADNVDEIDWENDGAEDVAVAADPTNMSSPSGLSTKRGREDDELISLDDENDAKRRKI